LKATLAAVSFVISAASSVMGRAVSEILPVKPRQPGMRLPPLPKWNKTTDDIDCGDFFRRSQDYERSLLPPDLVFPQAGQIWETVGDCEVHGLKWINGPPLWVKARLRKGERIRILTTDDPRPLNVSFQPVRYDELREIIAPASARYVLLMRTARIGPALRQEVGYFNELFRLVEAPA
jgi:hypothetical protein